MNLPLVNGIIKHAFIVNGGRRALEPWGGTTKDTGFEGFTNPLVGSAAYMPGIGLGRAAGPAAGLIEGIYGQTIGKKKAKDAGARYGAALGKQNPFLAARL